MPTTRLRCAAAAALLPLAASLVACGGGGGTATTTTTATTTIPTATAAAVPTVTMALSTTKASVSSPVTLSWSSTDATTCTGSDSWSGTQAARGSKALIPAAGGQFRYTITCIGAGGTAAKTVVLTVPMPVLATSYENKNEIALDDPKLPNLQDIPGVTLESGEQNISQRPVAFADFLQEGAFSAITASTFYKDAFPGSNPLKWPDSPAKLYFLRKDASGKWTDVTSQLIKTPSERIICVSPGFIEIADMNKDGRPDAVISCTGPDFTINGVFDDSSLQYAVLSQPDGSYRVVMLGVPSIYAHQVALADIDGDGNVDILSVDTGRFRTPIVLWGNGDGTIRVDATRFPSDMSQKAIYGIRAIPINGKISVVVSGNPTGAQPGLPASNEYGTKVLQYIGGKFEYLTDLSAGIPKVSSTGLSYALALDAIYKGGFYYFLRVNGDYTGSAIVKTDASTGASTLLTEVVRGNTSDTSGVLKLTSANNLVSQMANCGPNANKLTDYFHYQCTFSIPLR
jgi:hypothetical protein